MFNWKVFVVEFIGTFALVFVGAASGVYSSSLLETALAHGLTLAAFIYVFGHISGTHINPAVTLGLAANGNIKWGDAVVYWLAQFSGAGAAAYLLKRIVDVLASMRLVDLTTISRIVPSGVLVIEHPWIALSIEILLTFWLVNAVFHAAVDGKAGPFSGWVVGTTLTLAILGGGPLTGASLNPARSFGPALFTSTVVPGLPDFMNPIFYLIYFMGPFLGVILATMLYQGLKHEPAAVVDMDGEEQEESATMDEDAVVAAPVRKSAGRKATARKTSKK